MNLRIFSIAIIAFCCKVSKKCASAKGRGREVKGDYENTPPLRSDGVSKPNNNNL
jgi:hypothetical protein